MKFIKLLFLFLLMFLCGCTGNPDSKEDPNDNPIEEPGEEPIKEKDPISIDVNDYGFISEELVLSTNYENARYEIIGDNKINAHLTNNKLVADSPGVITIIAKSDELISEPRIITFIQKDEDVKEVILSSDILKMDLGNVYSFGLDKLPKNIYTVSSSDEAILKVLENNNIEVVGSGRGELKIKNNLTNKDIYDDIFVVYNSILLTEIKNQLINMKIISSMASPIRQNEFDYITNLDLSNRLANDNEVTQGIKFLRNLKSLELKNNNITDISFLDSLDKLENLDISNNEISNLSPLDKLVALKNLNLSNNKIVNVATLRRHEHIESLNLVNNQINDLSPISTLYGLKKLYMGGNAIDSVDHISALVEITELDVSYASIKAEDIFGLDYFRNLEYIDLSGINFTLTNLPTNLIKLKTLKLNDTLIDGNQLNHLLNYNGLEHLEIANNSLDLISLETLMQQIKDANAFDNLKSLSIGGNIFVSIPDLSPLENLEHLSLANSYNLIELDNLILIPQLKSLDLSYSNSIANEGIQDIFDQLINLESLSVVDGLNYFDRELFDYFVDKINNETSFAMEIFADDWMRKNSVNNYAKVIYFSIEEMMHHLVNEGEDYQYQYQTGQRKIILNLINEEANQPMHIILPRDIFEFNIYSTKLKYHSLSFSVLERKQSSFIFNLFNFKTKGSVTGNSAISTEGEAKLLINYSGENELRAYSQGHGVFGYNIEINPINKQIDMLKISGGQGADGNKGPDNGGSKASRRGENGAEGFNGIYGESIVVHGLVTIVGGNGGRGGDGGERKTNPGLFAGSDGNSGNGGTGGTGGAGISTKTLIKDINVSVQSGEGGSGGSGGKNVWIFYDNGNNGKVGSKGENITYR